jgi:hypothetical protein
MDSEEELKEMYQTPVKDRNTLTDLANFSLTPGQKSSLKNYWTKEEVSVLIDE